MTRSAQVKASGGFTPRHISHLIKGREDERWQESEKKDLRCCIQRKYRLLASHSRKMPLLFPSLMNIVLTPACVASWCIFFQYICCPRLGCCHTKLHDTAFWTTTKNILPLSTDKCHEKIVLQLEFFSNFCSLVESLNYEGGQFLRCKGIGWNGCKTMLVSGNLTLRAQIG